MKQYFSRHNTLVITLLICAVVALFLTAASINNLVNQHPVETAIQPKARSVFICQSHCPSAQIGSRPASANRCQLIGKSCRIALLAVINGERVTVGAPRLRLDLRESRGTPGCIGASGHAKHMAEQGQISHDQFPSDICGQWGITGENVGVAATGNRWTDILQIHGAMDAEPYPCPPGQSDHKCNFLNPAFECVGFGFASGNFDGYPATYLSEDFKDSC